MGGFVVDLDKVPHPALLAAVNVEWAGQRSRFMACRLREPLVRLHIFHAPKFVSCICICSLITVGAAVLACTKFTVVTIPLLATLLLDRVDTGSLFCIVVSTRKHCWLLIGHG